MPDALPELTDDWARLWQLVRRVAKDMDGRGDELFRTELDVSLARFLVLRVVDAHPGQLNQQSVADRLGLTKGTISRQVDGAVTAGQMTSTVAPHSRRENSVALTAHGKDVVRRGDELFAGRRRQLAAGIDEQDLAATLRVLSTMAERLDGVGSGDPGE